MNYLKKILIIPSIILSLLILTNLGYSACTANPNYIKIYSGGNYLGTFNSEDTIYIKPNLYSDNLKVEFFFENEISTCYTDQDSISMQLFNTGSYVNAQKETINQTGNNQLTKATINFNVNTVITNDITSNFKIKTDDLLNYDGKLTFKLDNTTPEIEINNYPEQITIHSNNEISINYTFKDLESKLALIRIVGGKNPVIESFDEPLESFSQTFIDYPSRTKQISFIGKDALGNEIQKDINVIIDDEPPVISNLKKKYSYVNGIREVSFTADIKDTSFYANGGPINVYANLSSINPSKTHVPGICEFNLDKYECEFNKINVMLDSTTQISLSITASDYIQNTKTQSFSEEIYIDSNNPIIEEFYLENGLGIKNILSTLDKKSKVILKASDDSNLFSEDIIITLGQIQFPPEKTCSTSGNSITCEWEINELINVYLGQDIQNETFTVQVRDKFSNIATAELNVNFDNKFPVASNLEIIETESIKDKIIKSQEVIDFRILVSDENIIRSGEHFIYGNFSTINYNSNTNFQKGECNQYNSTTLQCDFQDIKVINGYVKRNITILISDISGNRIKKKLEVEILKVGDEIRNSYSIDDISILNTINRNHMQKSTVKAWFEGNIEMRDILPMKIINYQIVGCDDTNLDPLLIIPGTIKLFPTEIITNSNNNDINKFALSLELKPHTFANDLNMKNMSCTLSILKRDDDTIYPPELIKFNLDIDFYDIPRGDLLTANAKEILEDINDVNSLGKWFDNLYEIYQIFYSVCSAITTTGNLLTQTDILFAGPNYYESPSSVVTGFSFSGKAGASVSTAKNGIMDTLTDPNGMVQKMCNLVTCQNGGLLGSVDNVAGKEIPGLSQVAGGLEKLQDFQNDLAFTVNPICAIGTDHNKIDIFKKFKGGEE